MDGNLAAEAKQTIEALTRELLSAREENQLLKAKLRSQTEAQYRTKLASLDTATRRDDGSDTDRQVLQQKVHELQEVIRTLERHLLRRKTERNRLVKELEEALIARAKDLDTVRALKNSLELANTEARDAKAMATKWQTECIETRAQAEASIAEVRALAKDSIDTLSQSLKRSVESQENLKIELSTYRKKHDESTS